MSNTMKPEKIISAMASIVAAVTNMRLYPPTSAIISNAIDKAFSAVRSSVIQDDDLLIAESENNILISGQALSYKHQQLPQVVTLREIMGGLRMKSIILKKEMDKLEFKAFLYIMSMTPEDVELEGGIQKITSNADLPNIVLTPKIYVTVDQERAILGSLDPADINLIKSFIGEHRVNENDFLRISEKAGDAQWVSDLFESGVKQISESGATISDTVLSKTIGEMFEAFDNSATSEARPRISEGIVQSLYSPENDMFSVVMANNNDGPMFDSIVDALDDDQFADFLAKVNRIREEGAYDDKKMFDDEKNRFNTTFKKLAKEKRTSKLSKVIKERIKIEKEKTQSEKANLDSTIEKIMNGDQSPFADELMMSKMPGLVSKLFENGQQDKARALINRLSSGLVSDQAEIRAGISAVLQKTGEKFSGEEGRSELIRIAHSLNLWVKTETEFTPSYEPVCKLLQNLIRYLLKRNQYSEANNILETFSFIFYGRTPKIEQIRAIAGKVLRTVATEEIFDAVMYEFNTNNNNEGQNAYYTLIRLGMISLDPLLDQLRSSGDMSHRVRIMNAITEIGKETVPSIVERLQHSSSWFYIRNLLKLLTQLGGEDELDVLKKLVTSEVPNISNAALNCAFDIGGERRQKFFTAALSIEKDRLRTVIIDLLGKLGNEESVYPLTELLKGAATGSSEAKNAMDISICNALGKIGSKKAVPALKAIVKQKGLLGIGAYSPEVRNAAGKTIKILNEKKSVAVLQMPPVLERELPPVAVPGPVIKDIKQAEALVREYVNQHNKPEAVKLLFGIIEKLAKEKNFQKAEEMRTWLFDIDPMALTEIVKSGDIIESEKSGAISQEYIDIWANLYDKLTEEEANALFYCVHVEEYDLDKIVIKQGELNSRLYFVNRGQLKIVYEQEGNEFFLKMIGAGDVAGAETFFPITVSTISLITLSKVKAGYIERDRLKSLLERFPVIEEKLLEFCSVGDGVDALINKKGIERRQQERIDVKGKALVQLLDTMNKPMAKPFKGDLIDVSSGGIAFKINTTKRDTARLLLGRKLKMVVGIVTTESPVEISTNGTIIGAKEKKGGQFSIHLKFDNPVSDNKISTIRSIAVPE